MRFTILVLLLVGTACAPPADTGSENDADVVVVGAGISGLSAALEAARGGVSVLVVDMWSIFGGHAVMSHGGLCIVGTPVQRAQGVEDNPELAEKDFLTWGEDANTGWVRHYTRSSREQIYDWVTEMGVEFSGVLRLPGNSVARFHEPIGRGLGLVSPIYRQAVLSPNTRFEWNFKVDGLVTRTGAFPVSTASTCAVASGAHFGALSSSWRRGASRAIWTSCASTGRVPCRFPTSFSRARA